MKLTLIAEDLMCNQGVGCPAVHETDPRDEDVFVQGYEVVDPEVLSELSLPPGEAVVRIPRSLLLTSAAKAAGEGSG